MAQIDASSLYTSFSAFDPNAVSFAPGTDTPFSYSWTSSSGYHITALSYLANITAGLGGTVQAINISDAGFGPMLSITGLNTPLNLLVDAGNAVSNHEKFWNNVLAGDTTIFTPNSFVAFQMMGDFVRVGTGETMYGGDDSFLGGAGTLISNGSYLVGDAITVNAGGTLYGGVDRFIDLTAALIVGDVGGGPSPGNSGVVYGGDDIISITDPKFFDPQSVISQIIGDVFATGPGSSTFGGDDTITLTNIANVSSLAGDAQEILGVFEGGDDSITLQSLSNGLGNIGYERAPIYFGDISGDGLIVSRGSGGAAFSAIGGNDSIRISNANGTYVQGDVLTLENATFIGGDDTIEVESTRFFMGPTSVEYMSGDIVSVSLEGESFTGGDDVITVDSSYFSLIVGDAVSFYSTQGGEFHGGNDRITTKDNNPISPTFGGQIFGDADFVQTTGANNSFGDDVIEHGTSTIFPSGGAIYGDSRDIVTDNAVVSDIDVMFGDDIIRITSSHSDSSYSLFGDANVTIGGGDYNVNFTYGNDFLQGGVGNDLLVGDGIFSISAVGIGGYSINFGRDTLDGGLGNDILDGGDGLDTASFASVAQAVVVALDGIPGSAADPADYINAIGQGNDRFISIENVIGSSRNDIIIGSSGANVIEGGAGADNMIGNGGIDTLSYASSTGFVNVSLATGYAGGGSGSHAIGDTFLNGAGGNSFYNLIGSDFDDILSGDANTNELYGGAGNDVLRGRAGGDHMDGGEGEDWIDYSENITTINVSLSTGYANGGVGTHALGDTFNSIENIRGSNYSDRMTGDGKDNVFEGRAGNDSMYGGAGSDTADYASSVSYVNVSLATGFVGGGAGSHALGDVLDSIENLRGSAHNDILSGNTGDNNLRGRAGADTLNGYGGNDTADYADSASYVNVSLLTGYTGGGAGNHASGDVFSSIESLAGSAFDDILNGSNGANSLQGRAGADVLRGNGGNDTAVYTESNEAVTVSLATGYTFGGHAAGDTFDSIENLIGSGYDDILSGDTGANRLTGGEGDDLLRGRLGADTLDGGAGSDTADYADASGSVNISLNSGYVSGSHAAGDVFISIENLTGSAYNDTLSGDGGENVLAGLAGNDSLRGYGGADLFVFGDGFGNDIIGDFEDGLDKLDLSGNTQVTGIADLIITNSGADALVSDAFGNSILLQGEANNISGDDFIF